MISTLNTKRAGGQPPARQAVVPVRHYGRGVGTAILVLLIAGACYAMAVNPNFDWSVVGRYVFAGDILRGLLSTLEMTAAAMVLSVIIAVVVAVMRLSQSRVISWVAAAYIFFFRAIPVIVLLIFLGNLGLFAKRIIIGVPFTGVVWWSTPTGQLVTPFVAAVLGLTLAGSAYMAEIVRGGLLSVGRGQRDAAKALGLTHAGTLRYIVIPQALKVIVPPMGNEFIGMLKASAIASVIGGGDLLAIAEGISGTNYRTVEMLIVASIWYFTVIAVWSIGQYFLERRAAER